MEKKDKQIIISRETSRETSREMPNNGNNIPREMSGSDKISEKLACLLYDDICESCQ